MPVAPPPERIGPWKVITLLGSGGMGDVYLAEHGETGAKAAVKVLTASLAREAGFVERFNREIDAMRKVANPHIVELYDSGEDNGNYYYAMEFVEGETLLALMRRDRRLPWKRAVEISIEVCRALKSAHDTGIIHRDLKPSNLLLTPDGFVKLTDFGVAQVFASQRLTVTGGIIGTAEYMSPEQAQGKRATKQSDLYSLGAVLYAMVTGRTPFSGATAVEVIQKHKFGLFDRPRLIVHDLPPRVEETICKLLEKDPAKRYPDALVLQRHLEQLLRHEDFLASSAGITLADSSELPGDADTTVAVSQSERVAAKSGAARSGPATLMQSLMREQLAELQGGNWLSALFNNTFVLVGLLLAVIAGGVWWFWPRTVAPDEAFAAGVALLEQPAGPEWLRAKKEYFGPLVARDSAAWKDKVAPYLQQIELYELTRPSRGARRGKGGNADSEPERFLQLAQHYREIGDVARAERILVALQAFLSASDEHAKVRDLASRLLDELRTQQPEANSRHELLQQALARAKRLAAEGKSDEARAIWSGLIELYGEDAEAAEFVSEARAALARPGAL
ncbi:MAG: serine/threonine-protein kinase [Planctomycetaceae bacterium]